TPIYEGTTGIQAADLIGRKIARDSGAAIQRVLREMVAVQEKLLVTGDAALAAIAAHLSEGIAALRSCVAFVIDRHSSDPRLAAAGAVPLLEDRKSTRLNSSHQIIS